MVHACQGYTAEPQSQQRLPYLAVRGSDIRMDSILPPVLNPKVVPRSYTKLNSTYLRSYKAHAELTQTASPWQVGSCCNYS